MTARENTPCYKDNGWFISVRSWFIITSYIFFYNKYNMATYIIHCTGHWWEWTGPACPCHAWLFNRNQLPIYMVKRLFIKAAIHRSSFSSKQFFIKAAFHWSSFSSKQLFIEAAIHRSSYSSKQLFIKAAIRWSGFSSNTHKGSYSPNQHVGSSFPEWMGISKL